MKAPSPSSRIAAFSLIELMVVIGVIILLAGLTIGALPGIQASVNRKQVETFMGELESGLSKYQLDNGIYPQNPPSGGDRDAAGRNGANVLYKRLSGDFDEDGEVDFENDEKVYVQKLDYSSQRDAASPRSNTVNNEFVLVDSFGNLIRYLAEPPNIPEAERETFNPTYDLWSIADGKSGVASDEAKHIKNW